MTPSILTYDMDTDAGNLHDGKTNRWRTVNVKHNGVILDRRKDFEPEGQALSFGLVVIV